MKLTRENVIIGLVLAVFVLGFALVLSFRQTNFAMGSVSQGSDYQGTTTRSFKGTAIGSPAILNTGNGSLGSVIITGAGAGIIHIYDATSTETNAQYGTTTLATFPLSTAAGTYVFDRVYFRGLVVEIIGTTPTSTITWR